MQWGEEGGRWVGGLHLNCGGSKAEHVASELSEWVVCFLRSESEGRKTKNGQAKEVGVGVVVVVGCHIGEHLWAFVHPPPTSTQPTHRTWLHSAVPNVEAGHRKTKANSKGYFLKWFFRGGRSRVGVSESKCCSGRRPSKRLSSLPGLEWLSRLQQGMFWFFSYQLPLLFFGMSKVQLPDLNMFCFKMSLDWY